MEEWRDVVGYEGRYQVSNFGRVKSLPNSRRRTELILSAVPSKRRDGRVQAIVVNLTSLEDGKWRQRVRYVHDLVAAAFLGPRPSGLMICHNDGDPTKNCIDNLRYDTHAANCQDRIDHGRSGRGETNGVAKLTLERVRQIKAMLSSHSIAEVSRLCDVNYSTVRNIANGNNWGWVK